MLNYTSVALSSEIIVLKGVGSELSKKMAALGIRSIEDLLEYYPRRYEDYSNVTEINKLKPGSVTVKAVISQISGRYLRRGLHITEAIASDSTGSVRLIWFNQPYRSGSVKPGMLYFVAGEYGLRRGRFTILNPAVELVSGFPVNTARIVPLYRETKGIKSTQIRRLLREAINEVKEIPEHLPAWLLEKQKLMDFSSALRELHFPSSAKNLALAKKRLGFEEVFELTLAALLNKHELKNQSALAIPFRETLAKAFVRSLPFKLTNSQRRVAWQIYQDMSRSVPMNRLIEGDVGSGKTVVAAMSAVMALEQKLQVALMSPTEVLARQHAKTIAALLDNVGYGEKVGLLIGSLTGKQKLAARRRIATGDIGLVVGTHALISEQVDMQRLGLIIIDEQHRFGVEQRKSLQAKAGHMPHALHMTATPIPRSLALTLYGELDISVIDEKPPGRQKVKTKICSPNSRRQLYKDIDIQLGSGKQMFVVTPLIADSENSNGLSAQEVFENLSDKIFKNRRVGLLHGKMKSVDKNKIMQQFVKGSLDILVTTTVIEVGVDVPNATIMLIEGAERFGLAQLHQLRGRVGRGDQPSHCFLMMSGSNAPDPRLQALETTDDGFKLAELDLAIRGPGAIYGTLQHGALDLRVAKLTDTKLIAAAKNAAREFIERGEKIQDYPHLKIKVTRLRKVTSLN